MNKLFNKIGLAITFSPTGKALLNEVKRLKDLFNSQLVLIHVGEKNSERETLLKNIINDAGIIYEDVEIIWSTGDPGNAILKSSRNAGVDLLVAGALEKENFMKYYIGSVARKIMRENSSSTLILTSPSEVPKNFKKFFVSADYTHAHEKTILQSYRFAQLENADEFIVIKDFNVPGLASTVLGSGSAEETQLVRETWVNEEEEKMKIFLKELNLTGVPLKIKSLYGKAGWEAGNYARENKADIFVIAAPIKKLNFLDRLFSYPIEYLFENLPTNLLIIR